jgi:hypothetical protein
MQIVVVKVPGQDGITRDNVRVRADAVPPPMGPRRCPDGATITA